MCCTLYITVSVNSEGISHHQEYRRQFSSNFIRVLLLLPFETSRLTYSKTSPNAFQVASKHVNYILAADHREDKSSFHKVCRVHDRTTQNNVAIPLICQVHAPPTTTSTTHPNQTNPLLLLRNHETTHGSSAKLDCCSQRSGLGR